MYKKVFIIDDDEVNNFVCEKLIINSGLAGEVCKFETAREALQQLNYIIQNEDFQDFPEVIFLDINMPYMDGWDFLEEYKKLPRNFIDNCNIYMLSSSINTEDIDRAKSYSEVVDYITKPLNMDTLSKLKPV